MMAMTRIAKILGLEQITRMMKLSRMMEKFKSAKMSGAATMLRGNIWTFLVEKMTGWRTVYSQIFR